MRRKLTIAAGIIHIPEMLFLDEPIQALMWKAPADPPAFAGTQSRVGPRSYNHPLH
jgi:ABC-type lipopolysaccharide export system ATPase subunit